MVTEKKECRVCGEKLSDKVLLDLGEQAIVDFLDEGEVGRGTAPLHLVYCADCKLVQLRHTVDKDTLFKKFWYRSSMNEQMRAALKDVVESAMSCVDLGAEDLVLDIGSNDGELLLNYPAVLKKVGYEPAEELSIESTKRFLKKGDRNSLMVQNYFEANSAMVVSKGCPYKIVTAVAMFYDLDDPIGFLRDVKEVLAHGGVFVVQMNYLGLMIRNLAFDNISHEHLCYYSLTVLKKMFEAVGLGIFDVELNDVNGGSIRVYATHEEAAVYMEKLSVKELLISEEKQLSLESLGYFAVRIKSRVDVLMKFLKELKKDGKKVYTYGASTRGMTLLQTVFRGEKATDYIVAAAERDKKKYGKKMAGLDIPIVAEEVARKEADYMLVLPYHFWQSISKREKSWMMNGGRFIIPLPYPKIVKHDVIGLVSSDLHDALETMRV